MRPPIQLSAETHDGQIRLVRFGDSIRLQLDTNGLRQHTAVTPESIPAVLETCCERDIETVSAACRTLLEALLHKLPAVEFHGTESFELPSPICANETRTWRVGDGSLTIEPCRVSLAALAAQRPNTALPDACDVIVGHMISARTGAIRNLYRQLILEVAAATSARIAG